MSSTTPILSGETLFDVVIRKYGHMQGIAQLVKDNDIGFTDDAVAGEQLLFDDDVSYNDLATVTIETETEEAANEVTVEAGQNIFDLVIQVYGDLSGLKNMADDNDLGLTDDINAGATLKTRSDVDNQLVVDYLNGKGIKPATALTDTETEELTPEGIGYWQIEYDFIVS